MVKLYHYTNTAGKDAIESSKYILKSVRSPTRDDAAYGEGVYLTSLGPTNSTAVILGNNYDGRTIRDYLKEKTEWYFEFDSADIVGVEQMVDKKDRDIWLLRDKNLSVTKKAGQRRV